MPSDLQRLTITVSKKDYHVFTAASDILREIMREKAPSVVALVEHQLADRDAIGVADDFLDSIGWPLSKGRSVIVRRVDLSPIRPVSGMLPATSRQRDGN